MTPDGKRIFRKYLCSDFSTAVKFIDAVAKFCDEQQHHPTIHLSHYRHLIIEFFTYASDGVTENDMICAKLADNLTEKEMVFSKFYKNKEERKNLQKPGCNYDNIFYPPHGPHTFSDKPTHK